MVKLHRYAQLKHKQLVPCAFFLYAFVLFYSSFTEGVVITEWIISFNPFFRAVSLVIIIGSLIFQKTRRRYTTDMFLLISIIFVGIATFVMAKNMTDFAYLRPIERAGTNDMTLAFFNKYYNNS